MVRTATNPQTGEKVMEQGGQWVPYDPQNVPIGETEFQSPSKAKIKSYKGIEFDGGEEKDAFAIRDASKAARSTAKLRGQLFQTLLLYGKAQNRTDKVLKFELPEGPIKGFATDMLAKIGKNPSAGEFEGDKVETATSIAKIAAPSAKVGPELIRTFSKTIPTNWTVSEESLGQIISSRANSLYQYAATHKKEYPNGVDVNVARKIARDEVVGFIKSRPDVFKKIYPELFKGTEKKQPKQTKQERTKRLKGKDGKFYNVPQSEIMEFKKDMM